ncbi:MAG: ribonucleotide reductase N-terminal alpha domain-containing protein, partial [Clostridium butyricum]
MSALNELCIDAVSSIKDEEGVYSENKLLEALNLIIRDGMSEKHIRKSLIQVALELTTDMEPNWQFAASKIYTYELYDEVRENRGLNSSEDLYKNYYDFISQLTDRGLYGKYILDNYTKEDILELEKTIKPERDFLFNYSGINLLSKRYLVQDYNRNPVELPQQMFMGIAMHLAIPEDKSKRVYWAKRFYDVLSSLKATMATPTMSNARKPFYQLSSCFIDTVEDSLEGIYKSLDNFAQVSKFGGGMGIYMGKVRALGSS